MFGGIDVSSVQVQESVWGAHGYAMQELTSVDITDFIGSYKESNLTFEELIEDIVQMLLSAYCL